MTNETQNNASAPEELITRISQVIKRKDGSEVKITAQAAVRCRVNSLYRCICSSSG